MASLASRPPPDSSFRFCFHRGFFECFCFSPTTANISSALYIVGKRKVGKRRRGRVPAGGF